MYSYTHTLIYSLQLPDRDAIRKKYIFHDFMQAFGFMSQIALFAEKVWLTYSLTHLLTYSRAHLLAYSLTLLEKSSPWMV